jgi:putative transposase
MKFAFIAREKATFPIDLLCSVLGVSRAGFYATRRRPVPARRREDQQLAVHVAAAHAASRGRYGSPASTGSSRRRATRLDGIASRA